PVWRRELHEKFGYFDEKTYGASADWEFWLRCGLGGAMYFLNNQVLGVYYMNDLSYGRTRPLVRELEKRIFDRYVQYANLEEEVRDV
ncbi:hypothetical protein, partial [Limnospira sp. PMC 1243.20]